MRPYCTPDGHAVLAGAAEQAEIDVFFETVVEFDASFSGGFDEMNSLARRLGLEMQSAMGRTLIQTSAAMHALVELWGDLNAGTFAVAASSGLLCGSSNRDLS